MSGTAGAYAFPLQRVLAAWRHGIRELAASTPAAPMPHLFDRFQVAARRFARAWRSLLPASLSGARPPAAPPEDRQPRPKHSLVLWLHEPFALDPDRIAAIATRAYSRPFNQTNGSDYIIGQGVNHVMHVEEMWFLVLHMARPYPRPEATPAQAQPDHGAWLSIDLMAAAPEFPVGKIDDYLGRFLAELPAAGAKVVAIFHPETGRLAPWAPAHREQLACGDPLSVFDTAAPAPAAA